MTPKGPILVLTCLFVVLPIALASICPSKEDVAPCICRNFFWKGVEIECHGINNEDLARVTNNLKGMTVSSFIIEDSNFGFITRDVFKEVKFLKLFVKRSTMKALTDKNDAFVGLEDHLEQLYIFDCVFTKEWDWSVFKNLRKLETLVIEGSLHLGTIGVDLTNIPPSLEIISFASNNLSVVDDHAFVKFKYLTSLNLGDNEIRSLKRTMLPNPAMELSDIDVRYNLIEIFPDDMFTNMPNIRILDISFNKILVLNENTFSPIWELLDIFYNTGNELRCDCRMSWLLQKRSPFIITGPCAFPKELKGKALQKLTSKDLVCDI